MGEREPQWHYVRPIDATRLPRRHVLISVGANTTKVRREEVRTWRCGIAIYRDAPKGSKPKESERHYEEVRHLWADVDAFTTPRSRTILWAHNLSYSLRVSAALEELTRRGWRVSAHNLEPAGTWMSWRKDDRTLMMVDSASVFPTTIAALVKHFAYPGVATPGRGLPATEWWVRCTRDVRILREAVVAYLDMLEAQSLGPWQPTGTGQAWAAFRHRFLTERMLVHQDEDARAAERRAMWTGRCEAYWHGRTKGGTVQEWDMTMAYPRVAATHDVPVELVTTVTSDADLRRWMERDGYDVLAKVRVDTTEPMVPTLHEGRIAWPVGSFATTLWGPELRLLAECAGTHTLAVGWVYRMRPALADWATWLIGEYAMASASGPAWWADTLKHWGRSLIGRFAMSYRSWEYFGEAARRDIRQWTYIDRDASERGIMVQIGQDIWVATSDVEWSQAQPAITGYIQSIVRVELTNIIRELPPRSVLYADTDSVLVSGEHWEAVEHYAALHPHLALRLKRSWQRVEILGPRQLITGDRVRVSGVPVRAQRAPNGTLQGEVWQSLRGAMTAGTPSRVRITPRRWKLHGVDARRVAGADGWTEPHHLTEPSEP